MIPILFEETETQFASNGIGRLSDAISCKVTEELNGQYELEMVYPVTGQHFESIQQYALIYATHEDGKSPQPFEIYRVSRPINGKVSVYAHHISYRLNKMITTGANVTAAPYACQTALNSLISNAILPTGQTFDFTLDGSHVSTGASFSKSAPQSVRSRLLGSEGSILDQYGGTFEWDMFNVIVHPPRGEYARGKDDSGIVIRYGKNLTDVKQEANIENTITGVIPFWQSEEEIVTGSIQTSRQYDEHSSPKPRPRIISVDFTSAYDTKPTVADLEARGKTYATEHGDPEVSITVSFVDLAQTEEYKDIIPLTHVHLDDEVTVQYEQLGINTTSRITKVVYDVLTDKYESIVVGDLVQSFGSVINDTVAEGIAAVTVKLSNDVANATKWLTNADGYVIAVKDTDGSWKELIFADAKDQQNWHNLIRINNNGIGFSTDGGAHYTQAWTIDGHLLASFIHGGTLTLGGNNNTNGWLKILNASGTQIGKWDKDGISANNGTFSGIINATSGTLQDVTVNSLKLGNTTWTGSDLDDRLNYILEVALTANEAADLAADAALDASSASAMALEAAQSAQETADKIAAGIDVSWFPQKDGKAYLKNIRVEELEVENQLEVYKDNDFHTGEDDMTFKADGKRYYVQHGVIWKWESA